MVRQVARVSSFQGNMSRLQWAFGKVSLDITAKRPNPNSLKAL